MRPHAGGPARVWTDDTLARVREALGRHRTIAAAASDLGMSASGIQSAFWSRREQLGGAAKDFLFGAQRSAPVSAAAIPVVQGSAPQVTPQVAPQVTPQVAPHAAVAVSGLGVTQRWGDAREEVVVRALAGPLAHALVGSGLWRGRRVPK